MNFSAEHLIGLALALLIILSFVGRDNPRRAFRSIKAFKELRRSIELSVEDGSQLQISLGRDGVLGPHSAAAFAGLTLLNQVANTAADSDQPPIATTGDPALMLMAQDTLRHAYQRLEIPEHYHPLLGQATGLTPFSYASGSLAQLLDGSVSASALVGHHAEEAALISTASGTRGAFSLGGSPDLSGQALLFASTDEPLLGEEVYATGAYLDAGPAHQASLRAQDVLRWVIILAVLITAGLPLLEGLL
ncbi:MAG: hypothetical protein KIS85_01425 [Anaerolineales bacterium]|nr:hypothetical protein [Anaerolineales bacterium]